ncbi:MAG: hypothetical protein HC915_19915 [Anaerolineae bacterium]|nr:hypothetical protein [Anaerolineae bacterium]
MSNNDYEDLFSGLDDDALSTDDFTLDDSDPFSIGGDDDIVIPDDEESGGSRAFLIGAILLAFLFVIVVAIVAALLIGGGGDECDERCQQATEISGTNFAIETSVRASETALSVRATADEGTRVAVAASNTAVFIAQETATQNAINTAVGATQTGIAINATATQRAEFENQTATAIALTPTITPTPEFLRGNLTDPVTGNPGVGVTLCIFLDDGDGVFNPSADVPANCLPEGLEALQVVSALGAAPEPGTGGGAETPSGAETPAANTPTPTATTAANGSPSPSPTATSSAVQATATSTSAAPAQSPSPTATETTAAPAGPPTPTRESVGYQPGLVLMSFQVEAPDEEIAQGGPPTPTRESLGGEEEEEPTATATPTTRPSATATTAATEAATEAPTSPADDDAATPTQAVVGGDRVVTQIITDAEGNFILRGLPEGTYFITIGDETFPVEVRAGAYTLDIPLAGGQVISLRVEGISAPPARPTNTPTITPTGTVPTQEPGQGGQLVGSPSPTALPETGLFTGSGDDVTGADLLILLVAGGLLMGIVLVARQLRTAA